MKMTCDRTCANIMRIPNLFNSEIECICAITGEDILAQSQLTWLVRPCYKSEKKEVRNEAVRDL
jgi:hypothetical protein